MDAFCAEVDQLVGVNLLPQGERPFNAGKIAQAAALLEMKLEADGAFHLHDATGRSVITLVNQDARPFQSHTLAHFSTPAVTLLLDVPRVENPAEVFDQLVQIAQSFARTLPANLVDDHRVQLTDAALARTRTQIVEVAAKMCARNLAPGSIQARRLFS
jgi:FtsZ-interacting cell division protein ZipA